MYLESISSASVSTEPDEGLGFRVSLKEDKHKAQVEECLAAIVKAKQKGLRPDAYLGGDVREVFGGYQEEVRGGREYKTEQL